MASYRVSGKIQREENTMNDKDIVTLFFERSQQAITELSQKYGKLCFHIALNILKCNTYNTTQSNFAEVLREFFQKFFLISYYGKVSKMPNKSERKKLQTAKIITLSNLLFSYG